MLSNLEAWALKRVLCLMPLELNQIKLSDPVYFALDDLARLPAKGRPQYVQDHFPQDIETILRIDPNQEPPPDQQEEGKAWRILHISKLDQLPRVGYLLEPFVIERGLTVLYGASGTFKSFAALDYALQVSQFHPAIYAVYEGVLGYRQRIAAWCEHHNRQPDKLQMFILIGMLAMMDTSRVDEFIQEAGTYKPALVVIDTVARAMTGSDENSTRDMGLFVNACGQIQRDLNCAVLVVHHTSKQGIQERGSGALRGAADIMIKQSLNEDIISIECDKSKDAEPFPTLQKQALPVEIQIDGETLYVPVLIDAKLIVDDGTRFTKNQVKVLQSLAMDIFAEGATVAELMDVLPEVGKSSIYNALERLFKLGMVAQDGKRQPYTLTENGRAKLDELRS